MRDRMLAFGDLHLNWQAGHVILNHARNVGINTALSLGDEAHKIFPFEVGDPDDYHRLYAELRSFRDEPPQRTLICVLGDKTAGVPPDLWQNYVGITPEGKVGKPYTYHEGNVIAGHNGRRIEDEHGHLVGRRDEYEPLVIFHGHSHSMGVLPEYKWLSDSDLVHWLKKGHKLQVDLKPHSIYWVNPGGNFFVNRQGRNIANFAIYDPLQQRITLQSIFFDKENIKPRE